MPTLLIILYFVIMLLISLSAAVLFDPLMYWTHRKGYPTPGWKFLVALPLFLGILGTVGVGVYSLAESMNGWGDLPAAGFLGLFLLMLVPAPACLGLSLLILRLLPKRKVRIAGSQRSLIPYAGIGYAFIAFAGLVVILSLVVQDYFSNAVQCALVTALMSGMMFYQSRRAKTPTVEQALTNDQRPPLLYLRSFDQEAGRFAEVSPEAASKYSDVPLYRRTQMSYNLTLEQFLHREIKRQVGPFIALGNPTDYLPPEGASRTYATDGNWQEYFTDLSDRSAGILMQIGNSDNLNWELNSIRKRGLQNKLFVITSPMSEADEDPYSLTRVMTRLTDRIKGIQPASWSRFAANLERAGYHPPPDPGAGAVVTFDSSVQAMKLVSGAKTPEQYVTAINKWLETSAGNGTRRKAGGEAQGDGRDSERARVETYGTQILICPSCGTKNSLSFAKCLKCSKDLGKERPVPNPFL